MKRAKQLGFQTIAMNSAFKSVKHFGGAYLKNSNAKTKRPVSTKRSMHLVLRSSLAVSGMSLLRKHREIIAIVNKQGRHHGVQIYRQANAGNHIHLIVRAQSRNCFHRFIRSISGLIARLMLGAERGRGKNTRFWDKRPFTRIVEWGREFKAVNRYLVQNTLEAFGFVPYKPRRDGALNEKRRRTDIIAIHSTA